VSSFLSSLHSPASKCYGTEDIESNDPEEINYSTAHTDIPHTLVSAPIRRRGVQGSGAERLEQLLLLEGLPIAVVPSEVYSALIESGCVQDRVTPGFVRGHFSVSRGRATPHPSVTVPPTVGPKGGNGPALSKEECLSNALYLLQYSFLDVCGDGRGRKNSSHGEREAQGMEQSAPYSALHGLSILPLEDGTLGVIEDSTGPPLYLVSSAERKLLHRAGGRVVVADSVLGALVSAVLRDPLFAQHCNVRALTPVETLKVLRSILPAAWFDGCETAVTDRGDVVSDEWLGWLWSYIISEKSISLFEGVFPLLPILPPAHMPPGSYLVKVSPIVPVLHMSYCDLPPEAADALCKIGVYTLDSALIGSSAYSQDVGRLVSEATPRGLLAAVCVAAQRATFTEVIQAWPAHTKRALRDVLLDRVVLKLDVEGLSEGERAVLLFTPVWEIHTGGVKGTGTTTGPGAGPGAGAERESVSTADASMFVPITPPSAAGGAGTGLPPLQIPPRDVDPALVGSQFLVLRSDADRVLYGKLGLVEPSKG
jgi:hypothetical protein